MKEGAEMADAKIDRSVLPGGGNGTIRLLLVVRRINPVGRNATPWDQDMLLKALDSFMKDEFPRVCREVTGRGEKGRWGDPAIYLDDTVLHYLDGYAVSAEVVVRGAQLPIREAYPKLLRGY